MGLFKSSGSPKAEQVTEEEKKAVVEQLKGRFADTDLDEVTIERFAFTRSWDLDGSTKMIQKHVEWRRENLPVKLEEVKSVLDEGKFRLLGAGSDGQPVFLISLLKLNKTDFKVEGEMQRHVRAAVYCAEQMIASMAPGVVAWTAIMDCTGIRGPPQAFLQDFTKVMTANYPSRAEKIVMYPVPKFIIKVAETFMGVLPPKTRDKVCFTADLSGLCKETGLELSALPESMVGKTDLEVLKGASVMDITAGKSQVHRHALAVGDVVKWSFQCMEHNIGFELRFVGEDPTSPGSAGTASPASASPASAASSGAGAGYSLQKVEKIMETQGEFTAEQAGVLEFTFDNTFSYMRGKTVVLSVQTAES